MKIRHIILPALFAIILMGCEPQQNTSALCAVGDSEAIGFHNGQRGATIQSGPLLAQQCQALGVQIDLSAYERGRQQGLQGYCTADRFYFAGRRGFGPPAACPQTTEFLTSYYHGRDFRRLERRIDRFRHSQFRRYRRY